MDVIPGILTERELRYFTDEDYHALAGVSAEIVCNHINNYIDDANSDPEIVNRLQTNMGSLLARYRLNKRVTDEDTIAYIDSLVPEALPQQSDEYQNVIDRLQFLEGNYTSIIVTIPPRKKPMYMDFLSSLLSVLDRMSKDEVSPTYGNLLQRIDANKFMFYVPNEKTRTTRMNRIISTRRKWTLALNGARYLQYCQENGIGAAERRRF